LEGPHLAASYRDAGHPASWRFAADRLAWEVATEIPVARLSRRPGFPGVPGVSSRNDFRLSDDKFVLRPGELAQGFPASNFKIFTAIREIHK